MAFDREMKMMGGKGKRMQPDERKGSTKATPHGEVKGEEPEAHENEGGVKTHTIEEHPDGHFESHMHDGTHEVHPHHLHLSTHIAHHLGGGGKHLHAHHDGMGIRTHSMDENEQHEDGEHNSAEEAADHMSQFLNEEAQEPEHQHAGAEHDLSGY